MFPFCNAALSVSPPDDETMQLRETANHTDPTQAGDEHSTQKVQSTGMINSKERRKEIRLHKIFCEYIYNCKFSFLYPPCLYYFEPIQLCYIKAKHSLLSAQSPMSCRYLCFPSGGWLQFCPSPLSEATIHHILSTMSEHHFALLNSFHQKQNCSIKHKTLKLHEIHTPIIWCRITVNDYCTFECW